MMKRFVIFPLMLVLVMILMGCAQTTNSADEPPKVDEAQASNGQAATESVTIVLGAYTTPREAYGKLLPIFQKQWKQKTGQEVTFEESYLGSGAQSRAIVEGFEADVAALSLEADITRIEQAGLITHNWKDTPTKGIVSTSIVVLGVRKGNPLGIKDWADLARPGVEILTPNPKTSGGAMWNILALYGAAKRGFVAGVPQGDEGAQAFLEAAFRNVTVMDKGTRESITNYEQGVGDVIITYENEILVGQKGGQDYEYVIPRSTILIENPIAVIDTYVDKHGNREVVEAFVEFLHTREAQEIFAEYGLRSVDPEVATATADRYPAVEDLFTIEEFGGWPEATPKFFGDEGIFTQTITQIQGGS
jgi:sulfate transport system substrate-binding protein